MAASYGGMPKPKVGPMGDWNHAEGFGQKMSASRNPNPIYSYTA